MNLGSIVTTLPLAVFAVLAATVLLCVFWDKRRTRLPAGAVPVSVIVPCFNDGATVAATLRSVFASYPPSLLDVVVANDASTDDSLARIREVQREFPMLRLIDGACNTGKVAVLNSTIPQTKHSTVLFVDADTVVTERAIADMLARITHDPTVGAVSCPYSPLNRGFLPAMQAIEYSMMRLGQGAGNVTSALALWGGCLMVRKEALQAVDGFSLNAITEDVDLAFKLNRAGWRVEQSFVFVQSVVPDRWFQWFRQKRRWTAGGFQCVFRYADVWIKNPLQLLFVSSYAVLSVCWLCSMMSESSLFQIGRHVIPLWANGVPMPDLLHLTNASYGPLLGAKLVTGVAFSLLSVIYVVPTINRLGDWIRIALVIPFSMAYFPLYLVVSLSGLAFWFFGLRRLPAWIRAW